MVKINDVFWRQQSAWRQIKSRIITDWWYLLLNSLLNSVFAFERCNLKACFCRRWLQNLGLIDRSLVLTSSSRCYWRKKIRISCWFKLLVSWFWLSSIHLLTLRHINLRLSWAFRSVWTSWGKIHLFCFNPTLNRTHFGCWKIEGNIRRISRIKSTDYLLTRYFEILARFFVTRLWKLFGDISNSF